MCLQPILADRAIELRLASDVQEKSEFQIRRAEIAEQPPSRIWVKVLGGFELYDEPFVDDHIQCLSC